MRVEGKTWAWREVDHGPCSLLFQSPKLSWYSHGNKFSESMVRKIYILSVLLSYAIATLLNPRKLVIAFQPLLDYWTVRKEVMLQEVRKRKWRHIIEEQYLLYMSNRKRLFQRPPFQTDKIAVYIYGICRDFQGSVIVMNLVNVNKSIISQNSEQFFCI